MATGTSHLSISLKNPFLELIPFASRESFHLLLGSRIFVRVSSKELGKFVYFIVDNMNRGSKLLESSDQKIELARLNLQAGTSMKLISFFSHSKFMLLHFIAHIHVL